MAVTLQRLVSYLPRVRHVTGLIQASAAGNWGRNWDESMWEEMVIAARRMKLVMRQPELFLSQWCENSKGIVSLSVMYVT